MRTVTIQLQNWRLPAAASPNDSSRWAKARARKELRWCAWAEAKQQCADVHFGRARISVTLRVCRNTRAWAAAPGYRPRDEDNALAALKGFFDGLVDAGIVPDDNAKYLTQDGVTIYSVSNTTLEGLAVTIEELEQ